MKKIAIILMLAFSATAITGYAQDKGKDKKDAKCTKLSAGMSCCKKPTSRAALLNAKPATTTASATKKAAATKSATKSTAPKKAA